MSKHQVVRLTNAVTSMDICVVHLRRPIGNDGVEEQRNQCRALLRWAMRHLSSDSKANVVIMGDFNELCVVESATKMPGVRRLH